MPCHILLGCANSAIPNFHCNSLLSFFWTESAPAEEKETASYLTQNLRLNGFVTETDYLNKGLKGEFKSADRLNAKYLIILNDKDLEDNKVNVKDNMTKEEEKVNINDLVDYLDMHM